MGEIISAQWRIRIKSKDIAMNLTTFFAYARRAPFGGRLTQAQIDGMTAILTEWDKCKLLDNRWLAYMLATAFHETATVSSRFARRLPVPMPKPSAALKRHGRRVSQYG